MGAQVLRVPVLHAIHSFSLLAMRILIIELLAATSLSLVVLLQGCGGAYSPTDPTPEPHYRTTTPAITRRTTTAPDLGDYCCWYPKHEDGKDDRTDICRSCKTQQYKTKAKYCSPNGGTWCGKIPVTTTAKPTTSVTTTGHSTATTQSGLTT